MSTTRKRWTDYELGELQSLNGLPLRFIAENLGRSENAVQKMRKRLEAGWAPVIYPWTDDDLKIACQTNLTAEQVAEILGRTKSSVATVRSKLTNAIGIDFSEQRAEMLPFNVGNRRLLAKTCLGCGLLLDASWFYLASRGNRRSKNRTWTSRCTRCSRIDVSTGIKRKVKANLSVKSTKAHERAQRITKEIATRSGFPWIDDDHVILRDSTKSNFEKALLLGRTLNATSKKVVDFGYTSRIGKGDPMKGAWHIDNPNDLAVSA